MSIIFADRRIVLALASKGLDRECLERGEMETGMIFTGLIRI